VNVQIYASEDNAAKRGFSVTKIVPFVQQTNRTAYALAVNNNRPQHLLRSQHIRHAWAPRNAARTVREPSSIVDTIFNASDVHDGAGIKLGHYRHE